MNRGVIATGEGIALFSLLALRSAVMLEASCPGLKATRGRSATAIAKSRLGLKRGTSRDSVILALDQAVEAQRTQVKPGDIRQI
jgi:hypothetical protein